MKKISLILTILLSLTIVAVAYAAQFWASSVEDAMQGEPYTGVMDPDRSNPEAVLGMPDNDGSDDSVFYSLGDGGYVTVKLDVPVDESLEIYEATWYCPEDYPNEDANVYVSPDGVNWTLMGVAHNKGYCSNGYTYVSSIDLEGRCTQYVKVEDAGLGWEGDGFDVDAIVGVGEGPCMIIVEIDVKPNSDPSCFNSDGKGVIPVAVLGSEDFDVHDIDPSTLLLDGAPVVARGKSGKVFAAYDVLVAYEDYNFDGYIDLVAKFTDIDHYTPLDVWATLTGALYDGTPIQGVGDICIVQ